MSALYLLPVIVAAVCVFILLRPRASRPEVTVRLESVSFSVDEIPIRVHRANGTIDHFTGKLGDSDLLFPPDLVLGPGDEVRVFEAVRDEVMRRRAAARREVNP